MPQEVVCINGQVVPAEQAGISVFDAGFMHGVGLFETMRAYGGRVFRLEPPPDRLTNPARSVDVYPGSRTDDQLCQRGAG